MVENETISSYDLGWEHGYKARKRYETSDSEDPLSFAASEADRVAQGSDEISQTEYYKGFRDGLIHVLGG